MSDTGTVISVASHYSFIARRECIAKPNLSALSVQHWFYISKSVTVIMQNILLKHTVLCSEFKEAVCGCHLSTGSIFGVYM